MTTTNSMNWTKTKVSKSHVYRTRNNTYSFSIMKLGNKWITDACDRASEKWFHNWNTSSTLKAAKEYVEYFCAYSYEG